MDPYTTFKRLPPLGAENGNNILMNYFEPKTRSPWGSWARVLEGIQVLKSSTAIYIHTLSTD